MSRKAWMWALGALAGIVLTAAITWAASRLTSQHIGLSSEPLTAGQQLAPKQAERQPEGEAKRSITTTATSTTTAITTSTREHRGPDD